VFYHSTQLLRPATTLRIQWLPVEETDLSYYTIKNFYHITRQWDLEMEAIEGNTFLQDERKIPVHLSELGYNLVLQSQ
jgi:hypothetical protein